MKVIDLQTFRYKKQAELLEKRIGEISLSPKIGSVHEIKVCFREWLKVKQQSQQ